MKHTILCRIYSGRIIKDAGFVYLKGLPYLDAEGSSQLRSRINDERINAAPIIGGGD